MLFEIAANVLTGAVEGAFFDRWRRSSSAKRFSKGGDLECSLRVIDGSHRGLSTKWTTGHAVLRPGSMTFNGIAVPIRTVDRDNPRRPHGGEIFAVNRDCTVLTMTTTAATLELALFPEQLPVVLARVAPR